MKDQHTIIVKFTKDTKEESRHALKKFPKISLKKALVNLFIEEMQKAYDDNMLSGQFEVIGIAIDWTDIEEIKNEK